MERSKVMIKESCELPINKGLLEVNTRDSSITIFMKSVPAHSSNEYLTIAKISDDNNTVCLFSEQSLVGGAEIVIFGVPKNSKFSKGKNTKLILKSDGYNWNIVGEE